RSSLLSTHTSSLLPYTTLFRSLHLPAGQSLHHTASMTVPRPEQSGLLTDGLSTTSQSSHRGVQQLPESSPVLASARRSPSVHQSQHRLHPHLHLFGWGLRHHHLARRFHSPPPQTARHIRPID